MAEAAPLQISALPAAMHAFIAKLQSRPIVPLDGGGPTLHVGDADLPWLQAPDGSALQLLHVDLRQGLWISKSRLPPGHKVVRHYHTGVVFAVTLQGRWCYEESPEAVNAPGSYLFEPAGSLHTLVTPKDQVGDTIAWFAIYGANVNIDSDGKIISLIDARYALELYQGYCKAMGLDCSKLIIQGG